MNSSQPTLTTNQSTIININNNQHQLIQNHATLITWNSSYDNQYKSINNNDQRHQQTTKNNQTYIKQHTPKTNNIKQTQTQSRTIQSNLTQIIKIKYNQTTCSLWCFILLASYGNLGSQHFLNRRIGYVLLELQNLKNYKTS